MQNGYVVMDLRARCAARVDMCVYAFTARNYRRALAVDAVWWAQAEASLGTELWRSVALQMLTAPDTRSQLTAHGPAVYNGARLALLEGGRGL